jgi:hypothetical protein
MLPIPVLNVGKLALKSIPLAVPANRKEVVGAACDTIVKAVIISCPSPNLIGIQVAGLEL